MTTHVTPQNRYKNTYLVLTLHVFTCTNQEILVKSVNFKCIFNHPAFRFIIYVYSFIANPPKREICTAIQIYNSYFTPSRQTCWCQWSKLEKKIIVPNWHELTFSHPFNYHYVAHSLKKLFVETRDVPLFVGGGSLVNPS